MIPKIELSREKIPETEAIKFVRGMKVGINLGNTFDAVAGHGLYPDELSLEAKWCGAYTTREMIAELHRAGFETLRLPVSWKNHLTDDDFTISDKWLARVGEVVDWALDEGMYVILNTHHDISPRTYYPTSEHVVVSEKYMRRIWTKLADYFSNHGDHLIFESMNEPRMPGHPNEWHLDVTKADCLDSAECINRLNQVFVDAVRSVGGKNTERYLYIPGYDSAPESPLEDCFRIPADTADGRLIISVHSYRPYNFALQSPLESGSTDSFDLDGESQVREATEWMDGLYERYISRGIPVIVGEWGVRKKGDNLRSRVDASAIFCAYASSKGIVGIWWDNNAFGGDGENFGLFDRLAMKIQYPEILEAIMTYSNP